MTSSFLHTGSCHASIQHWPSLAHAQSACHASLCATAFVPQPLCQMHSLQLLLLDAVSCCSLAWAVGCSWLHQTTWKPAASFLLGAKVTDILCSAVTHCQPECGAMVELLKELNGDGNFGQFVRSMRKAWQQQLS